MTQADTKWQQTKMFALKYEFESCPLGARLPNQNNNSDKLETALKASLTTVELVFGKIYKFYFM